MPAARPAVARPTTRGATGADRPVRSSGTTSTSRDPPPRHPRHDLGQALIGSAVVVLVTHIRPRLREVTSSPILTLTPRRRATRARHDARGHGDGATASAPRTYARPATRRRDEHVAEVVRKQQRGESVACVGALLLSARCRSLALRGESLELPTEQRPIATTLHAARDLLAWCGRGFDR